MIPPGRSDEVRREAAELAADLRHTLALGEGDAASIAELFRLAHTVHGLVALLEAPEALRIACAIEDVLDDRRHGRIAWSPALRAGLDRAVQQLLGALLEPMQGDQLATVLEELAAIRKAATCSAPAEPPQLPEGIADLLPSWERARLVENLRKGRSLHRVIACFSLADFEAGLGEIRRRVEEKGEVLATLPAEVPAEIALSILVASSLDGAALAARLQELPIQIESIDLPPPAPRDEPSGIVRAEEVAALAAEMLETTARAWGKEVRLEVEGADTQLPAALAAALRGPLLHLIRNAVDHGIEPSAERLRRGKAREGLVRLAFVTCEAALEIRVEDDGAGIDEAALSRAADAMGLSREGGRLALVFEAGLSTAAPGGPSGHGVGLDAVREAVVRLGGTVQVESEAGRGARFRLRFTG